MKKLSIIFLFAALSASAQNDLPVKLLAGTDTSKAIIFYITGDGGWNNFSTALATALHAKGYTVAGLNAKNYFWQKRTPEETAAAIGQYIETVLHPAAAQPVTLVGYSFGADVIPFLTDKLSAAIRPHVHAVVLLSPSATTDFEIHVSELLGWNKKRSMDVPAAVNAMTGVKINAVFGDDETEFPLSSVRNRNFMYRRLPGGHHYEGNINMVAAAVIAGL